MWERQLSGTIFTDGQDFCSDKIAVGQDCCSGKIAARTSATEAEAAAAKNIPAGKVKETATAITLCKRNNCAKGTTFMDGEDCRSAKSVMVEMEEMDAALKNVLVGMRRRP